MFYSFQDINAWQEARVLLREIRAICKRPDVRRDHWWVDQISRSALSILANIAEGNDAQTNAEFAKFLGYSKRSCSEVSSHLYAGLDEKSVSQLEFDELQKKVTKITGQLASLIRYLLQSPTRLRRAFSPSKKQPHLQTP